MLYSQDVFEIGLQTNFAIGMHQFYQICCALSLCVSPSSIEACCVIDSNVMSKHDKYSLKEITFWIVFNTEF